MMLLIITRGLHEQPLARNIIIPLGITSLIILTMYYILPKVIKRGVVDSLTLTAEGVCWFLYCAIMGFKVGVREFRTRWKDKEDRQSAFDLEAHIPSIERTRIDDNA